jgi:hypothetical protein
MVSPPVSAEYHAVAGERTTNYNLAVDLDYLWHLASMTRADLALTRAHAGGTAAKHEIRRAADHVGIHVPPLRLIKHLMLTVNLVDSTADTDFFG